MRRRQRPQSEEVVVLMTGDRASLALAKSLLDSAGLRYAVDSDVAQDLFGWGVLGSAYNFVTGPARVMVHRNDEEVAREILSEIPQCASPSRPLWLKVWVWIVLSLTSFSLVWVAVGMLRDLARHLRVQ